MPDTDLQYNVLTILPSPDAGWEDLVDLHGSLAPLIEREGPHGTGRL